MTYQGHRILCGRGGVRIWASHYFVIDFFMTEIIYEDVLVRDFENGCTIAKSVIFIIENVN